MKILWINPVYVEQSDQPFWKFLETAKAPGTEIDVVSLKRGPRHLEYHYYEALALADVLHEVRRAEKEGYDGAVIGCFYDPGLREAREISNHLVVTAPAEATLHIATTLGRTFSIIVGRKKWIPKMHENVARYGFESLLASFKSVDLGVLEFQRDKKETARRLREAAREAVERDQAEVIILGCTAEFGFYRSLQAELKIPVLDAVLAPLKYAEFLVQLRNQFGWSHSKICEYQSPPRDEIKDWNLEEQYGISGLWK